jgi:hypothetical protein
VKPALADVVEKFLHTHQHRGLTPYEVRQDNITYHDLDDADFITTRPAWGSTYVVRDHSDCHWGTHCFKVGPNGELEFASSNWDTSG